MVNLSELKIGQAVNIIGGRGGLTGHYSHYAFCGKYIPKPATVLSVGTKRVRVDVDGRVKSVEARCLELAEVTAIASRKTN